MTRQTREVLWDIYTLLLLRERLCRELGVAMKPLPMDAYGVEDEEAFVPELTDARLVKAVEECQPYFWGEKRMGGGVLRVPRLLRCDGQCECLREACAGTEVWEGGEGMSAQYHPHHFRQSFLYEETYQQMG